MSEKLKLLYFASAQDAAQVQEETLLLTELPTPNVASLIAWMTEKYPGMGKLFSSNTMLAVNMEYVELDSQVALKDGDEVAVIPPVSGG
ncbi:molybdopterin synthase, small subunit CNX7 [Basidiobolus meristosporus CBS 931.73]|uniref:Molybdopterin synthase, small subunit CNX7 n=1 Tax=Basidiobolus meristosporus CBS 931.73 TaxID=1314790 RepID=A0A1Y1YMB2_9FUNG|nr:molybdopterin synthase, small subunit CNX7 [Basidiobolus meristosporus CBS 931.73]ORX98896.1 molybdopterin synthase, small subunit CNX7 [Basidiobolus meristosporus CBS 931.73]|eukprot:ORX75109.1 molybdopterin synthase, small subunit CNX7 [Basidiobolus meristosporus CBS 931.73]